MLCCATIFPKLQYVFFLLFVRKLAFAKLLRVFQGFSMEYYCIQDFGFLKYTIVSFQSIGYVAINFTGSVLCSSIYCRKLQDILDSAPVSSFKKWYDHGLI